MTNQIEPNYDEVSRIQYEQHISLPEAVRVAKTAMNLKERIAKKHVDQTGEN